MTSERPSIGDIELFSQGIRFERLAKLKRHRKIPVVTRNGSRCYVQDSYIFKNKAIPHVIFDLCKDEKSKCNDNKP